MAMPVHTGITIARGLLSVWAAEQGFGEIIFTQKMIAGFWKAHAGESSTLTQPISQ